MNDTWDSDDIDAAKADLLAAGCERDTLQQQLAEERELRDAINAKAIDFLSARQDLAALRSRGQALVQQWMAEVIGADALNRATVDLSTWGCIRRADALRACADALRAALKEQP